MRSDCNLELVWSGATIPPWGHERGELLSGEMRCECSALSKLISPMELDAIEAKHLRTMPIPDHHRSPETK